MKQVQIPGTYQVDFVKVVHVHGDFGNWAIDSKGMPCASNQPRAPGCGAPLAGFKIRATQHRVCGSSPLYRSTVSAT